MPLAAAVAGPSRPPARCGSSPYVGLLRPQLIVAELKSPRVEFSLALGGSISTWARWDGKLDVSLRLTRPHLLHYYYSLGFKVYDLGLIIRV